MIEKCLKWELSKTAKHIREINGIEGAKTSLEGEGDEKALQHVMRALNILNSKPPNNPLKCSCKPGETYYDHLAVTGIKDDLDKFDISVKEALKENEQIKREYIQMVDILSADKNELEERLEQRKAEIKRLKKRFNKMNEPGIVERGTNYILGMLEKGWRKLAE